MEADGLDIWFRKVILHGLLQGEGEIPVGKNDKLHDKEDLLHLEGMRLAAYTAECRSEFLYLLVL